MLIKSVAYARYSNLVVRNPPHAVRCQTPESSKAFHAGAGRVILFLEVYAFYGALFIFCERCSLYEAIEVEKKDARF
jgi:hypothetical protein